MNSASVHDNCQRCRNRGSLSPQKPTANFTPNATKLEAFLLEIRNKPGTSALTTLIQHSAGSPSQRGQRMKRQEKTYRKGEIELFLFADDVIVHTASLMSSIKKKPSRANE